MANIKVNQRKGHRAFVTKTIGEVNTELELEEPDEENLQSLQKSLSEKIETLSILDDEILETLEQETEINNEIDKSSKIRRDIQKTIFAVDKFFKNKDNYSGRRGSVINRMSQSFNNPFQSNAKLPKLSIKTFSGDPIEYQSFWDSVEAVVHANCSLDDIVKFNYLKSFLRGQALAAVEGLSLTSDNYREAVVILEKRYGNKQLLITSHIDKLMNIAPVKYVHEVKKIREVYDNIEVHVRNLSSLNIDISQYGPVLVSLIMSKLPEEIRLFISRLMPNNEQWDVGVLLENLKREIDSREMCQRMSAGASTSASASGEVNYERVVDEQFTASALHTGIQNISCVYCRRNHPSAKCNVVTDIQARKAIIRNKAKCFLCLRSGHVARRCTSRSKCWKCKGRHHISICDRDFSSNLPNGNRNGDTHSPRDERNQRNVSVTVASSTSSNTLLQTASGILSSNFAEENIRIL